MEVETEEVLVYAEIFKVEFLFIYKPKADAFSNGLGLNFVGTVYGGIKGSHRALLLMVFIPE